MGDCHSFTLVMGPRGPLEGKGETALRKAVLPLLLTFSLAACDSSPTTPAGGPSPKVTSPSVVQVPDLVGLKLDRARRLVTSRGLRLSVTLRRKGSGVGIILLQEASPGTLVDRGAQIDVVVSK